MADPFPPGSEITVIGAGIVGVCCAAELTEAGFRVVLVDQAAPGIYGASKANAGHIAGASILPLASPDTFKNIPGLLLDRQSPLYIPLRYRLKIIPWLWRFALSCREQTFMHGVRALADLNSMLWACTDDLYARAGILGSLRKTGALFLYESEASYQRALRGWTLSKKFGIETTPVRVEQISQMEAHLTAHFVGAIEAKSWGMVSDTLKVVRDIAKYASDIGARLIQARVREIKPTDDGVEIVFDSGERRQTDSLVIAAGAWSKHLTDQLGEYIPLDVERGYNITIENSKAGIEKALIFVDKGVVATQLSGALRIGGLDELGGLELPANPVLQQRILEIARAVFSSLDTSDAIQWMGHRPSMPDSLPVIGRAHNFSHILYAFGHGHYGLTHAPATGNLIASLASGTSPEIDITPFSSARFL